MPQKPKALSTSAIPDAPTPQPVTFTVHGEKWRFEWPGDHTAITAITQFRQDDMSTGYSAAESLVFAAADRSTRRAVSQMIASEDGNTITNTLLSVCLALVDVWQDEIDQRLKAVGKRSAAESQALVAGATRG